MEVGENNRREQSCISALLLRCVVDTEQINATEIHIFRDTHSYITVTAVALKEAERSDTQIREIIQF